MAGKTKTKESDASKKSEVVGAEGDASVAAVEVKKMKSLVLTSTSSSSDYANLQVKEEDYPKIDKDDQIMVRVKACGLNYTDLMQRQGSYKPSTKTPFTPGFEASGVVQEVSENVTDLKVGDNVIVLAVNGIWKDVVVLPRSNVIKMPAGMSFEDAAALLVDYLSSYQILFRLANIREGDSVLVHMASSAFGIAATQICKTVPNVTVFGTVTANKHEAIKEIGVDYPIDYTTSDYVEQIKKICPEGVDVVLDPLNGEHSIKGFDLLKPLGRIVHYGSSSLVGESRSLSNMFKAWWKSLSINSMEIITENKSISGYHLGVLLNTPSFHKTAIIDINALLDLYESKKIKIQLDNTYGFSKIGEAMKRMHARLNFGKIILKPDSEIPVPTPTTSEADTVAASLEQVKLSTEAEPQTVVEQKSEETTAEPAELKTEEVETKAECETEETVAEPAVVKSEEKIIEKTNVSEITKPESPEGECATRE